VTRWLPVLEFQVPGEPLPKRRPQHRGGQARAFTPKATRDAERRIADAFRALYPSWVPIPRGVMVRLDLVIYRRTRRPADWDNLAKLPQDALNGLAWADDEQIAVARVERVYGAGDDARTVIRVAREVAA